MDEKISEPKEIREPKVAPASEEKLGPAMASVLYSEGRAVYRLPAVNKKFWLSVMEYGYLPPPSVPSNETYLGPVRTANGLGYRRAYSLSMRTIIPGDQVTLPADDQLVVDFMAAELPSLR